MAGKNPINGVPFGQEKTREEYLARSAWEYDQASRLRAARHPVGYQALAEGHERAARAYEQGANKKPSASSAPSGPRAHATKRSAEKPYKPPTWKQMAADYARRAASAKREGGKVVRYPHGDLLILPVEGASEYYYSDWQADELLEKTKREYADLLKHISIEDLLLAQSQEW